VKAAKQHDPAIVLGPEAQLRREIMSSLAA